MLDLRLVSTARGENAIEAGYSCPCGCTPAATYERGARVATEGCCCGNQFAVGPEARNAVSLAKGYRLHGDSVATPWGESVPVAWAIGPSTHGEPAASSAELGHEQGRRTAENHASDPVCGMSVDPDTARLKGLHSSYGGGDYYFCGKGCRLEFDEDPERYLDAAYRPSM